MLAVQLTNEPWAWDTRCGHVGPERTVRLHAPGYVELLDARVVVTPEHLDGATEVIADLNRVVAAAATSDNGREQESTDAGGSPEL